jgi:hypothetical protein
MGMLGKLFGGNKSFDELMDEYYSASHDYISRRIDEKTLLETQLKILKQAARMAKDDKQKLLVNACLLELKGLEKAIRSRVSDEEYRAFLRGDLRLSKRG